MATRILHTQMHPRKPKPNNELPGTTDCKTGTRTGSPIDPSWAPISPPQPKPHTHALTHTDTSTTPPNPPASACTNAGEYGGIRTPGQYPRPGPPSVDGAWASAYPVAKSRPRDPPPPGAPRRPHHAPRQTRRLHTHTHAPPPPRHRSEWLMVS